MKTVSIKTLAALLLFVFLLSLRFKLYRDRQHSLQLHKSDHELPEDLLKTSRTSTEDKKVTEGNKLELTDITEIYEERRKYVGEMCRKHREGIEERYRSRWPDRTWETFLGKADILEKTDQGFLWCKVPKAASESWTSLFIKRWFRSKSNLLMWKQQVYLHSRWQPKYKTAKYMNKISKTHFNFVTVRHPFERILSAYRDKFFLNGNAKYEHEKVERWYKNHGEAILKKYRKEEPREKKYFKAPTFREFVEYLVELPLAKFDDHWKPMYMQCLPCHIQYHVIARLESLERDSAYILQSIGVTSRLPVSHTTQGNSSNNLVTSYYSQIDSNLLDKLYSLYKYDFLLFNFTHTHYAEIVKES